MGISMLLLCVFVSLTTAVHIEVSQKKTKLYESTSLPEKSNVLSNQRSTESAQLRVDISPRTKSSPDRQTFQYTPDNVDSGLQRVLPQRNNFLQLKRHIPLLGLRTITVPRQLRVLGRHRIPENARPDFSERRINIPSFHSVDSLDPRARISKTLSRHGENIYRLPQIQDMSRQDNRFRQIRQFRDNRFRDSPLSKPDMAFVSGESLNRLSHGLPTGGRQRITWSDVNQRARSLTNLRRPFEEFGLRDGLSSERPLFMDRSQTTRVIPSSPPFNRQHPNVYQTPFTPSYSFRPQYISLHRRSLEHQGSAFDSSNMFTPEQILNYERIVPF